MKRSFRSILFISGRVLSLIITLLYLVSLVIVIISGASVQIKTNFVWVGIPFISGSVALFVAVVVYYIREFINGRREGLLLKELDEKEVLDEVTAESKEVHNGE